MEQKPSVLIVSISDTPPKSIIKLLTNNKNIQEDSLDKNKVCHQWFIDTKYYTAEVELIGINKNYQCSEEFYENIEAFIIHYDSNKNSLDDLLQWTHIEDKCEPEIKLLITNYCNSETKISKNEAFKWCLNHGFELVELYPECHQPEDDIIEEKVGIDRVLEALQAHTWPNLIMKDKQLPPTPKIQDNIELNKESLDTDEGDDFSDMFFKLAAMRDSLMTVPSSQRKKAAEEMVYAFWRAMGEDEDEIDIDENNKL